MISVPVNVDVDPDWNINTLLQARLDRDPDGTLINVQGADGAWTDVSTRQFADQVAAVAKGFIALGIEAGDHVGIMARTSYDWTLVDYALWAAGAVSVPIYETSSVSQVEWICADASVKAVVVESEAYGLVVEAARANLPNVTQVWNLERGAIDSLSQVGGGVQAATLKARQEAAKGSDLATIIYTSGTTGRPKGTELDHGHFVRLAYNTEHDDTDISLRPVIAGDGCRTLLFLPLAHVYARFIQVLAISSKTVIGHCSDVKNLVPALGTFKPTFLLAVPRVLEKVYNSAEQKAGSGLKLKIFRWAAKVAIVYSRGLDTAKGPSALLKAQHRLADRLVYSSLRDAIGGNTRFAVSGGAPLGERLGHFYRGIGLTVLEGYGLTETTAPIAVNRINLQKIGSVGLPFPGCAAKISADGEILLSGISVFHRYHNNPQATAEAFDDGWYRTGDAGHIDDDGYLFITGRKKEMIVTAGGKNVPPALLEDRLRGHPLVSQVVVVGDNRPFVGALVTLDDEMLPGWLANHGKEPMTRIQAMTDPDVLASLDRAVERTNEVVSRAESIRKYVVLDDDFTVANGYLTPSLKVKRGLVLGDFAHKIEELYAGDKPEGKTP
jgi:long-chain acyl-CoA synthetase